MKQIVVSFSGGRTSAYLCSLIKKLYPDAVFVFMDTGAEHPATYDFVRQCNDYFDLNLVCLRTVVNMEYGIGCGYRVIGIDEIGHDLQPWRDMSLKYGLPYQGGAFCTRDMKTTPFEKYAKDRVNKSFGAKKHSNVRQADGSMKPTTSKGKPIAKYGQRFNVWDMNTELSSKTRLHPAPFPEHLVNDHILSWSNPDDVVFDCFMGSGTTGKMALMNNRKFIGIEKDAGYFEIAKQRLCV